MGRPLNKKYFGRRNTGSASTAADNGIGGSRIGSLTVTTAGAYTAAPTGVNFSRPLLEALGGVRATGTLAFSPVAGQITVAGTATAAYLASEVLTQATTGVTFTPTLTTISGNTITNTNGTAVTVTSGSYIKGTSFITGATVTTSSGLAANTTYYVAATTSSSTTVTLASTYANALAGTAITFTGGSTAISNGAVTIGTVAGPVTSAVYASGTVSTSTFNTTALAVTGTSGGAGQTIAVAQWAVASVAITEAGSGYLGQNYVTVAITGTVSTGNKVTVAASDELYPGAKFDVTGSTIGNLAAGTYYVLSILDSTHITVATSYANFIANTTMSQTTASGTMSGVASQHLIAAITTGTAVTPAVLTQVVATDSGYVGSATNQENALVMTAYLTGGSIGPVEIIRQVSTNRYKVSDGTRTGIVKLKSSAVAAAGEASIIATDASAGTYYVTKLTAHKATLTRGSGTVYTTGAAVPWTFGSATATYCKVQNA
jgi:hypothetical protein